MKPIRLWTAGDLLNAFFVTGFGGVAAVILCSLLLEQWAICLWALGVGCLLTVLAFLISILLYG